MKKVSVIIVAGGSGERMGTDVPKQFLPLCGETILVTTLRRFFAALPDSEFVVVLPDEETGRWAEICEHKGLRGTHKVCPGGNTRFESVKNGMKVLGECDYIAIHDGVRPLITAELIQECVKTAEGRGTAVPAVRPTDSYRMMTSDGDSRIVNRETLRAVQTPQVFRSDILRKAYETEYRPEFTDDASVVEISGVEITICEGDRENIKITSPEDLIIARTLMDEQRKRNKWWAHGENKTGC